MHAPLLPCGFNTLPEYLSPYPSSTRTSLPTSLAEAAGLPPNLTMSSLACLLLGLTLKFTILPVIMGSFLLGRHMLGGLRGMGLSTQELNVDVLVVCEKNSVAKAVASALSGGSYSTMSVAGVQCYRFPVGGRAWVVMGLRGHLMDFNFEGKLNSWSSVNPKELFKAQPVRLVRKEGVQYMEALKALGRGAEEVVLALDADVEGEGIAFEVIEVVKSINPYAEFKRAWFSSIDRDELIAAFNNLRSPNRLLAEKCFARSIIDLTVGASFTRLLTLSVKAVKPAALPKGRFISYGPCQSPTLYFVVQRALEREAFQSQKFYRVVAKLKVDGRVIEAEHAKGRFSSREDAEKAKVKADAAKTAEVAEVKGSKTRRAPPKPLDTIELESLASRHLNMRAKRALDLAEELYRRGFISYPRTETQVYPPSIYERLKAFAAHPDLGQYVRGLLKLGAKPTSGPKDDKAHPPIHPVKAASRIEVEGALGRDAWRLYELVARHFIATFSQPAQLESRRHVFNVGGEKFTFTTLEVAEKGFLAVYPYDQPREVAHLNVKPGDVLPVLAVEVREGETEPPPFVSESELLKLMEKWGIGTDATMQDHIQTNIDRGYMYIEAKRCIPTELGRQLIVQLEKHVPEVVRPEVRGMMERQLARIASGEEGMESVISKAKEYFLAQYEKLEKSIDEVAKEVADVASKSIAEVEGRKRAGRRGFGKPKKKGFRNTGFWRRPTPPSRPP
ncbi:MAG: DNA topoisomerase [Candidatus Nezhaarchaeota archaeon]|nr:DNA topoisomerase [Candidatus Nezhaarchaeota archaeon]